MAVVVGILGAAVGSTLVIAKTACGCAPPKPEARVAPVITGIITVGHRLSTGNGTWAASGNQASYPTSSYRYRWEQCDSGGAHCSDIAHATSRTYRLVAGDSGHTIRSVVTATNAGGSTAQPSAPTEGVTGRGGSGACASKTPGTADGPDPNGGCFPGPDSTGIPKGTLLTNYTGSCTVTVNNAVIDSKTINCSPLTIAASNVQIKDSQVNGSVWIDRYPSRYSFTLTDSDLDAGTTQAEITDGVTAIGKSNFTATRVNTHGGIRGVWCEYNCTVQDSYIHGQATPLGGAAHESGVRMGSGAPGQGQVIRHNSVVCDAPNVPPDGGCSADLTGYGDFGPIQNNTLSDNLFMTSTGGTCSYGGSSGPLSAHPYGHQANHNLFENNIFQRGNGRRGAGAIGHCGYWFGNADFDTNAPGNKWINNKWDHGKTMQPNA